MSGKGLFKGRRPFLIFLLFYLAFSFGTFRQYGECVDQMVYYLEGTVWLKHYKGFNTEAVDPDKDYVAHNSPFAAILLKLSFSKNIDLERLFLLNLLFAVLVFWLIYEILYFSFKDGWWALVGPAALFSTPRFLGDIATNPKDISFAILYFSSLAAIFFKERLFPSRPWRIWGLGIIFGFMMSHRIVGMTILPIYGLYRLYEGWVAREEWEEGQSGRWLLREVLEGSAIVAVSQAVLCALWPYIGADYFHHLFDTLAKSSKYDWDDFVLFEGKLIRPSFFPWNYLIGWITVITPLFVLAFFVYALLRWRKLWKKPAYFLMVLAFGFNLALYYGLKPLIFNGIRHYLFIVPLLVMIACFGMIEFFKDAPKSIARWAAAAVLVNGLVVAVHMVRLFPYDYLYFNELVGGIQGANGRYEMDYWSKSLKEAVVWLKEHEIRDPRKVYKIKLNGATLLTTAYFSENMIGSEEFSEKEADYTFVVNGARSYVLPEGAEVIHVVEREGVPLTFVLKYKKDRTRG